MNKRRCCECKKRKPIIEFGTKGKNASGEVKYQLRCKLCYNALARKNYKDKYGVHHREMVRRNNTYYREQRQKFVLNYLYNHPCVDCKEDDIRVLEFDHVGEKLESVSKLISNGPIYALIDEINYCEVVCANCHKKRTHKQIKSYRYLDVV